MNNNTKTRNNQEIVKEKRKLPLILNWQLDELPMSDSAFRVYLHLVRRAGKDDTCFPSCKSIGEHCWPNLSVSRARGKATDCIKELVKFGLVEVEHRKSENGGDRSNLYLLTDCSNWITFSTETSSDDQGVITERSGGGSSGDQGGDRQVIRGVITERSHKISNLKISNKEDLSPLPLSKKSGEEEREREDQEFQDPEASQHQEAEEDFKISSLAKTPNLGGDQYSAGALTKKSKQFGFQVPDSDPQDRKEDLIYDGDETPWLNPPPRSKPGWTVWNPDFIKWGGAKFFKKFNQSDSDVYDAEYNFKQSLINDPRRIRGRWEQYENETLHKVGNAMTRSENGVDISDDEKHHIQKHLKSVSRSSTARETLNQMAEVAKTPVALPESQPVRSLPCDKSGLTDNVEAYQEASLDKVLPPAKGEFDPEASRQAREEAKQKLKAMGLGGGQKSRQSFTSKLTQAVSSLEGKSAEQIERELPFIVLKANSPYLEQNQEAQKWCDANGFVIYEDGSGLKDIIRDF